MTSGHCCQDTTTTSSVDPASLMVTSGGVGGLDSTSSSPSLHLCKSLSLYVETQIHVGWEINMAKNIDVQVGLQFVNVHSTRNPPPVWEVKSIHPGDFGIAHAGLMNLTDPLHEKTVSFSALLDRTHYRLVSDAGAAA
jgi:hypothetical protein